MPPSARNLQRAKYSLSLPVAENVHRNIRVGHLIPVTQNPTDQCFSPLTPRVKQDLGNVKGPPAFVIS